MVGSSPEELNPGEVKLSWISVGDDGLSTGTASGYVVKYATSPFGESDWEASWVYTYPQSWAPLPPGSLEEKILSMPTPGATYYFAIKVYDDAITPNYSVISNTVSVQARPSGPADGIFVYAEGTLAYPRYYKTTSAGVTWSGPYNANNTASTIYWSVLRACPVVRNEKLITTLSSNGAIYIQRYDGQTETWDTAELLTTIASANAVYRCVDIAYEQTTGRAVVVFSSGSLTGQVWYRIWSSTAQAWVTEPTQLIISGSTGFIRWVRLEPRPATNEIMLIVLDSNNKLFAYRWNGSSWTNFATLTTGTNVTYTSVYQCFDVTWENTRGNCIILWGQGTTTKYAMWSSTASLWSVIDVPGPTLSGVGTGINWIKLASDRKSGSNNIAMALLSADAVGAVDWLVSVWNGTTWPAATVLNANMDERVNRLIDIAWEKDTGRCIAVGIPSAAPARYVSYSIWSAGSWSAVSQYTGYDLGNNTDIRWLQLVPVPNSNKMVLVAANAGSAGAVSLRTINWTGSSWAGGTALTALGSNASYEFFMLALDRHDNIAPTYANNQTGDDVWRNSNYATYDVDFFDTGGSRLAKVQTRLATSAGGIGVYRDWTDELVGLNTDVYTDNWKLTDTTWQQLRPGKTFVSLKIFDGAGNNTTLTDAFYVLKDTQPPTITNNLASGSFTTWYNENPAAIIDIDFADQPGLSLLSTAYYICSVATTSVFNYSANRLNYSDNWSITSTDWSLLPSGTNYFTVRVYDVAGNSSTIVDAFKILKDTIPPSAITTLTGLEGPFRGTINLSWIVPKDEGSGFVEDYLIKMATYPINTETDFIKAPTLYIHITPQPEGSKITITITGLDVNTTYYFRIRCRDLVKSPPNPYYNWSSMSNLVSCRPTRGNIWINEIYAYGSAGSDWVELYNDLPSNVSLDGWQIVYNSNVVWTGSPSDTIDTFATFLIDGLNFDNSISTSVVLKNPQGLVVNSIVYPSHNRDVSFARIVDGGDYFEFDPTPTKGYKNYVSSSVKINEVDYASSEEFVELYNNSNSTITFVGYIRNSSGRKLKFTRKLYPYFISGIDFSSTDEDTGLTYTQIFGSQGLSLSDFVVLENNLGQTIDRVSFEGTTKLYYNSNGVLTTYTQSAQAGLLSPQTIGRKYDGVDTGNNASDFITYSQASYGRKNYYETLLPSNTIYYPAYNTVLPRRFKFDIEFSTDYSKGVNNTIWFIRTGGEPDKYSPRIFKLDEFGFALSSYSVIQSTINVGVEVKDIDGHTLSTSTIYKIVLNTENEFGVSKQIIISSVSYDATIHNVVVSDISLPYANEEKYYPLLKILLNNRSPLWANSISLSEINIKFLSPDGSVPLTTQQAKDLFEEICIVKDKDGDGKFYPSVDNIFVSKILKDEFNLVNGIQKIVPNTSDEVLPQSYATYYFVVKISSYATTISPNSFKLKLEAGTTNILWADSVSQVVQPSDFVEEVSISSPTIIRPKKPPVNTSWPYDTGKVVKVNNIYRLYDTGNIYSFYDDGTVVMLSPAGVMLSSFAASASCFSPIRSDDLTGESGYIYFGTKDGKIYKNLSSDISKNVWVRNLSGEITSEVAAYYYELPAKIYVGTVSGYVYKISTGAADFWSPPVQISGSLVKTPSIDEGFTQQGGSGVSSLWWGTKNGYVYRLALQDGSILSSTQVPSAITTNIYYDAGFYNQALNSLNLYFGTDDGSLYCRYGLTLSSVPVGWTDVKLSSKINNVVFDSTNKLLYISCNNGVYKVDARSGEIIWFYPTESPVVQQVYIWKTLIGSPYIYFATTDGLLYSIHKDTKELQNGYPILLDSIPTSNIELDFINNTIIIGDYTSKVNMFKE